MRNSLEISLEVPIMSVNMVDEDSLEVPMEDTSAILAEQARLREEELMQTSRAFIEATSQIRRMNQDIIESQREQIVKLSIQIAEKILLKQIEKGEYDIEKIVLEALKKSPTQQGIFVRMNPEDLATWKEMTETQESKLPENIELAPDPGISRAECVVETDKGMIEYLVDEHLRIVRAALEGTE